ncbi:cytochrome P450 domain protein [Mycobacterium ulcerans str. Harvey]|uniref:Cytochrome P450 domain protein n=1 Tax=Mycobacterium ulcerans str. Harvey TaxID=1299332 RepID=A0ABP3A7S0_MYCUL|nr:cytochrome P450 domain protein [Mycobacterium ulcerans str. Harvey]
MKESGDDGNFGERAALRHDRSVIACVLGIECGAAGELIFGVAAERPVSWHPPVEDALIQDPSDPGFWAVTRRADIVAVSRTNEVFLSGNGVLFENVPAELLEASQSFLAMDPPRHTKLRKLVSAAFTPRQVRRIEDSIKINAKGIVEELRMAGGGVDFVEHCAKELPIRTLSDMVGIPEADRERVAHAADTLVSWRTPAT